MAALSPASPLPTAQEQEQGGDFSSSTLCTPTCVHVQEQGGDCCALSSSLFFTQEEKEAPQRSASGFLPAAGMHRAYPAPLFPPTNTCAHAHRPPGKFSLQRFCID